LSRKLVRRTDWALWIEGFPLKLVNVLLMGSKQYVPGIVALRAANTSSLRLGQSFDLLLCL